jgi:peptidoglycan/LPS O-acetylase OafA/YrhL
MKFLQVNSTSSSNYSITRNNNFDLLRLSFAFVVLLVHMVTLTKSTDLVFLKSYLSAQVAVDGFFVISGFLIVRSFEYSTTLKSYFLKRMRRVYPAYFVVVILSVLVGYFITGDNVESYLSASTFKYLLFNLFFLNFLQPELPGVFADNPLNAVNGALWTIKIEVAFYLTVPIFVKFISRFGALKVLVVVYALSTAYVYLFDYFSEVYQSGFLKQLGRQFPGQLRFFVSGALIYYFLRFFHQNRWMIFVVSLLGICVSGMEVIYPLCLGVMVIYSALFLPQLLNFANIGDYSFGLYIFHFPIIQTLIHLNIFNDKPYLFAGVAIVVTVLFASVSWNLIEKPFIKSKRKVSGAKNSYFNGSL